MASNSRDIADRLLGSSSEEEAQPPPGSRRRLEPADSSSATAAPAQESHVEEERWQRRVVPINMFGDGVPFGTADGSVQGIDHDAVAMGIPQEMVPMFLFNIGIRKKRNLHDLQSAGLADFGGSSQLHELQKCNASAS